MRLRLTVDHLVHLTTPLGLFEHALGSEPRPEHGYCVDDVARALVVTSREPSPDAEILALRVGYLDFVLAALTPGGSMHNRRGLDGTWRDAPTPGDHWGRGLWALGVTATQQQDEVSADRARQGAGIALRARSPWPRSMAYAALGAGELLAADPEGLGADLGRAAHQLLVDARAVLIRPRAAGQWRWIEDRLTYANAVLPEALLAIGVALADDRAVNEGLALLEWLVQEQQYHGHVSVVPSGGRSPDDPRPGFPQQPIEVACLAEAAHRAYLATREARWADVVHACAAWFEGTNDLRRPMRDAATGAGFDGLERHGVNENQGAESTLAWLSTHQLSLALPPTAPR